MFDEVHFRGNVYQTKDFESEMLHYFIEYDNRLYRDVGFRESVPKAERPYPDAPEGSLEAFFGCMRWVSTGREDTNYHGMMNIYRSIGNGGWEEFNLKFTDGVLVDCKEVKDG